MKLLRKLYSIQDHIRKILKSLPKAWRPKVTTIKEAKDLARIKLDEFLGSLKVHKQEIMNGIYLENALKASTSSQKTIRPQPLKKKMYYFWRGGRTSFHLKENLENEIHKDE